MTTVTLLGTGAAAGYALYSCNSSVCRSKDDKDKRAESGILISTADTRVIFDCGRGVCENAIKYVYQNPTDKVLPITAVAVTHSHGDHWFGIDELCSGLRRHYKDQGATEAPLKLFAHDDTWSLISPTIGRLTKPTRGESRPPGLEFEPVIPGKTYRHGDVEFHPYSVVHDPAGSTSVLPGCVAYGIEMKASNGEPFSIFVGGDMCSLQLWDWQKMLGRAAKVDWELAIVEANTWLPRPESGHLSGQEAIEVLKFLQPKRAVLTHVAPLESHKTLSNHLKRIPLPFPVEYGYDGMVIAF